MKKRLMRTDFEVKELKPGVYWINEYHTASCYLIVGTERALLIDTGTGIGNLSAVVRGITALPVTVAATHGHPDHLGGKNWFPEYYVHPADLKMSRHISWFLRAGILFFQKPARKQLGIRYRDLADGGFRARALPLEEGYCFELGNKTVEVYHTPGHTRGSVTFKLVEDAMIFSGDDVCPWLFLFLPGSLTVQEWIPGAKKILELGEGCDNYCGHGCKPIQPEQIRAQITLAEQIIREGNHPLRFPIRVGKCADRDAGIAYRPGHVRQ